VRISRRAFTAGTAATVLSVSSTPPMAQTPAQTSTVSSSWSELVAISTRARQLGLSVPRLSPSVAVSAGYGDVMPATVDLIDHLTDAKARPGAPQAEIDALLNRASDLLIAITSAERSPRSEGEPGELTVQYTFEQLQNEYISLFNSCVISDAHRAMVTWYVGKLTDTTYDKSYDTVEAAICVPWFFTGIIHAMEASFNFNAHLHNGDPLSKRTVHVPAGRPLVWLPPTDWASSAEDALTLEGFANQIDWTLARMLYRFEAYNGFGCRRRGVNTPYLWAFSNHYTKGKYVADGKWDPNYVSTQCGAAVMLKALLANGKAVLPA
jgi:lysozyme family protein